MWRFVDRLPKRNNVRLLSSNSVIDEEIKKFAAVGREWWDATSKSGTGPLHAMNPVRVQFIRDHAAKYFDREQSHPLDRIRGLKVLDVGCGGGLLSESLARLGAEVTAIDPGEENIGVAKGHSSLDPLTSTIDYQRTTVEEIANSGKRFDIVCSLEVIEHVGNPEKFLQNCAECIAPRGCLFISTMNKTHKSYAVAIAGAEYVLGLLPRGTHDWKKFITPQDLTNMIERVSGDSERLKVKSINGIVLEPKLDIKHLLSQRSPLQWALSETDTDVNYIAFAAKT